MNKKQLLPLGIYMFLLLNLSAQTTISLRPKADEGKDAILHSLASEQDVNRGDNPQMPAAAWTVGGAPAILRSMIGFDLTNIPPGAYIHSAKLSFFAWDEETGMGPHSTRSGSNTCFIQRITSEWQENTVTWNNRPTTTSLNQVTLCGSVSETQHYENIEVTQLVQDMIDYPSRSFGFLIRLQNETHYRNMNFASSDHPNPALHPMLVITYSMTPIFSNNCLTFQPDPKTGKDALLHSLSGEKDTNRGDNPQLPAASWTFEGEPGVMRSLIDFDLPPVLYGRYITSASLSLYAWDNETGMGPHSTRSRSNASLLQRVTSFWEEDKVTWNTQPYTSTINQVAICETNSPYQDYLNIDVRNLVQDMTDNPNSSFGFSLRLQSETPCRLMNFASSDHEYAALHPKLEVCYSNLTTSNESLQTPTLDFSIFPNPSNGIVNISSNVAALKIRTIEVFNSKGQLIELLSNKTSYERIDFSSFPTGTYFLRLRTNNGVLTEKLLIEK